MWEKIVFFCKQGENPLNSSKFKVLVSMGEVTKDFLCITVNICKVGGKRTEG